MRLVVNSDSSAHAAKFPALLLWFLRATDAAMTGALTTLKAAHMHAHAVIGQSQPERHGNAEILGACGLRPLVFPGACDHDFAGLWLHILAV